VTETLLSFFKALADESRLRMVGLLAEGDRSVQELATLLDLKEPTVSHHLAVLKAQGLVSVRAEGPTRWHRLDVDVLEGLSRRVLEPVAAGREHAVPETWDAKVLRGFVDAEGRLATIPASRRKRGVVLRWLMTGFEPDRRYSEAEVNAILQAKHPDSATLRRELIGHRMLARDQGFYWRLPEAGWNEGGAATSPAPKA
jgi:DNA-binding transcriptional ArsR family regulator